MAKDPAVLFYTSDFISGTITMTDEQRGKYILLLCVQHQKGSLTEKDMLKICKTYDEDIWCKFTEEGGSFYNIRMREETEKRSKYAESRRNNRKKKEELPEDVNNISLSYDEHMENENEDVNIIEDKPIVLSKDNFKLFDKVCLLFDAKIKKDSWLDIYDKLIRLDGYTEERILDIVSEFRKDGNWWKDNGNFQSFAKLRQTNKEGVKFIDVFENKMPKAKNANLGVGEFINANGNRTYGTSGVVVPNDAPPRPSNNHIWSKNEAKWKIQ